MSGSPKRVRSDAGAVLVEFSLVFVLFAFICYALVAFGLAMNLKSNLTHAATEGARSAIGIRAVLSNCDPAVSSCAEDIEDAVKPKVIEAVDGQSTRIQEEVARLVNSEDDPGTAEIEREYVYVDRCDPTDPADTAYCVTVEIPFDYKTNPIVPSAPGMGVFMPDQLLSDATVRITN